MNIPNPMPADEILFAEMSDSALNNSMLPQNKPGSNPWLKYIIVETLIIISGVIAYRITKSIENENSKSENRMRINDLLVTD
jgi:hypothetical protein